MLLASALYLINRRNLVKTVVPVATSVRKILD